MSSKNYYELLGLKPGATPVEIKRSYHRLARKYHPDAGGDDHSEALFQTIAEAYAVLSDTDRRRDYDNENGFSVTTRSHYKMFEEDVGGGPRASTTFHRYTSQAAPKSSTAQWRSKEHELDESQEYSGLNSLRFGRKKITPGEIIGQFGWIEKIKQLFARSPKPEPHGESTVDYQRVDDVAETLRGERNFYFTIDALESLHGTSRKLAIESAAGPRLISVEIPAGISHGALLNVNVPPTPDSPPQRLTIRIHIAPHQLVEREGNDLVLKIPITIGEAINGTELEVPTIDGSIRVKVPPATNSNKKLRLKGRGIKDITTKVSGDLYVRPVIIPPDLLDDSVKQAATLIDSHYTNPVRAGIPKKL